MDKRAIELLQGAGLGHLVDAFERLMMESICIKCHPVHEDELALGASKLGGSPDLPPQMGWPEWQGVLLPFIAQTNLSDAAPWQIFAEIGRSCILMATMPH